MRVKVEAAEKMKRLKAEKVPFRGEKKPTSSSAFNIMMSIAQTQVQLDAKVSAMLIFRERERETDSDREKREMVTGQCW